MSHTERIDKGQALLFPQTASLVAATPLFSCSGTEQADFFQISVDDTLVLALTFGTVSDGFSQTQVLIQTAIQAIASFQIPGICQPDAQARDLDSYRTCQAYQDFLAVPYEWPIAIRTVASTN